jgi:hypothetical protein
MIRDITGTYYAAIILGAAVCITGIAAYAFLMPAKQKVSLTSTLRQVSALAASKRAG